MENVVGTYLTASVDDRVAHAAHKVCHFGLRICGCCNAAGFRVTLIKGSSQLV
jgi:hypothetical protein